MNAKRIFSFCCQQMCCSSCAPMKCILMWFSNFLVANSKRHLPCLLPAHSCPPGWFQRQLVHQHERLCVNQEISGTCKEGLPTFSKWLTVSGWVNSNSTQLTPRISRSFLVSLATAFNCFFQQIQSNCTGNLLVTLNHYSSRWFSTCQLPALAQKQWKTSLPLCELQLPSPKRYDFIFQFS